MREEIRSTWLARDRERAEADRIYVGANADKIPDELRHPAGILPSQTRSKPRSDLVLRSQVFTPLDNQ